MQKYLICILLIPVSVIFELQAQDSLSVIYRQKHSGKTSSVFCLPAKNRLSAGVFRQSYSLTQLSLNGHYTEARLPVFLEAGDDYFGGMFHAHTYRMLSSSARTWGEAYYHNGIKKNVRWNESSDMELLHPYLTADSIGGNMKSESYFFRGGYARQYKKIIWSAEAAYQAQLAYRNIDPRPKNETADFTVKGGVGYVFSGNYSAMLSGSFRRYKQTGDLKYYSEVGNAKTYHLTGLGTDYFRFAGTNNTVAYKGNGASLALYVHPQNKTGYGFFAAYDYFSFDKLLTNLNNLPMTKLNSHKTEVFFSWMTKQNQNRGGLKLSGTMEMKYGTENIFGSPANSVYPRIATAGMYTCMRYGTTLSGFYEWESSFASNFSLLPEISYNNFFEQYLFPKRTISVRKIMPTLGMNWNLAFKGLLFSTKASGGYGFRVGSQVRLDELAPSVHTYQPLIHAINSLQSDHLNTRIHARCNIPINPTMLLFVGAEWRCQYFQRQYNSIHDFLISVGFAL